MNQFYAQLSDGSTMKKTADKIEIVNESLRVYNGDRLMGYMDLSTVLYAHISTKEVSNGKSERI